MRRRQRPLKRYSLEYLLSKQPKGLRKHRYYREMLSHYRSSPRLQQIRVSRRCYSLLLHARIKPEYLDNFYRTYRLPRDPFFPLYFRIKRDYLEERSRKREEKVRYIAEKMRTLPPPTLGFIKQLATFEQNYNSGNNFPVWTRHLFPATKKRVREYCSFTQMDWIILFSTHLRRLQQRYHRLDKKTTDRLLAAFILECPPKDENRPGRPHAVTLVSVDPEEAARNYRRLSKLHHPDLGGEGDLFLQLQWAKEILTGK